MLIHRVYSIICRSSTMTSVANFTTILFVVVDMGWCDHDPSPMAYWNKMFPDLAMPNPVLQSVPKMQQDDIGAKTMFEPKHFVLPQAAVRDDEAVANRAFFLQKNLVLDSKTQIYVPQGDCKVDPVPHSLFAPDYVKWSDLNDILPTYVIHQNSRTVDVLKETLKRCESRNAVNGRIQACVGSLEALVNLVTGTLGDPSLIEAMSWPELHEDFKGMYRFRRIQGVGADESMLVCHKLTYPIALFYCHQTMNTMAYRVSLEGVNSGIQDEAVAVCHEDTSRWNTRYIAFIKLGVHPGTPICHLLEPSAVIWFKDHKLQSSSA